MPSRSTVTRSEMSKTSLRRCEMYKREMPERRRSWMTSKRRSVSVWVRLDVGCAVAVVSMLAVAAAVVVGRVGVAAAGARARAAL